MEASRSSAEQYTGYNKHDNLAVEATIVKSYKLGTTEAVIGVGDPSLKLKATGNDKEVTLTSPNMAFNRHELDARKTVQQILSGNEEFVFKDAVSVPAIRIHAPIKNRNYYLR